MTYEDCRLVGWDIDIWHNLIKPVRPIAIGGDLTGLDHDSITEILNKYKSFDLVGVHKNLDDLSNPRFLDGKIHQSDYTFNVSFRDKNDTLFLDTGHYWRLYCAKEYLKGVNKAKCSLACISIGYGAFIEDKNIHPVECYLETYASDAEMDF